MMDDTRGSVHPTRTAAAAPKQYPAATRGAAPPPAPRQIPSSGGLPGIIRLCPRWKEELRSWPNRPSCVKTVSHEFAKPRPNRLSSDRLASFRLKGTFQLGFYVAFGANAEGCIGTGLAQIGLALT